MSNNKTWFEEQMESPEFQLAYEQEMARLNEEYRREIYVQVEELETTVDRLQTQVDDLERLAEQLRDDLGDRMLALEDKVEDLEDARTS